MYSREVSKTIRKFEKVDDNFRITKLEISFLVRCQNIIPNFLMSCLTNKDLENSMIYRKYQQSLLQTYPLCLENISKDVFVDEMKINIGVNGKVSVSLILKIFISV